MKIPAIPHQNIDFSSVFCRLSPLFIAIQNPSRESFGWLLWHLPSSIEKSSITITILCMSVSLSFSFIRSFLSTKTTNKKKESMAEVSLESWCPFSFKIFFLPNWVSLPYSVCTLMILRWMTPMSSILIRRLCSPSLKNCRRLQIPPFSLPVQKLPLKPSANGISLLEKW